MAVNVFDAKLSFATSKTLSYVEIVNVNNRGRKHRGLLTLTYLSNFVWTVSQLRLVN